MKTPRRLPIAIALLALACGTASAESTFSVSTVVTFTTDGDYTLTLQKFDPTICGLPGCTLNSATLYFFGSDDVRNLVLTNSALGTQDFDLKDTSNLNQDSDNSANSAGQVLRRSPRHLRHGDRARSGAVPDGEWTDHARRSGYASLPRVHPIGILQFGRSLHQWIFRR